MIYHEIKSNTSKKLRNAGFNYMGSKKVLNPFLKKKTWVNYYSLPGEEPMYTTRQALRELNSIKKSQEKLFD